MDQHIEDSSQRAVTVLDPPIDRLAPAIRLGDVLVDASIVSRDAVEVVAAGSRDARLGEALCRSGLVTDDDVTWALAHQRHLPYVDLHPRPYDPDALAVVPQAVASELAILPLQLHRDKTLDVAIADPTDRRVAAALRELPVERVRIATVPRAQLGPWLTGSYRHPTPAGLVARPRPMPRQTRDRRGAATWLQQVADQPLRAPSVREPRRDWQWGVVTGHRVFTASVLVTFIVSLYVLQDLLWPKGRNPDGAVEHAYALGALVWLSALIPSLLGLAGMLWYRHPRDLDEVEPIPQHVSFRIVTKGTNRDAVLSTVDRCRREMKRSPLFRSVIEVVSEHPAVMGDAPDVVSIVIPPEYETRTGARYKARALQYALEHSPLPDDAWIVHLDEETQPTSSGIKGIARMIKEEEQSGRLRIGQGAILYHRDWSRHPILTLADNVRTGDDFARFHLQHRIGTTLFGLHGSYIVCRNDVEKSVGFEFGPVGSITEDAFWALKCMDEGRRARWVDGYLEEQSTQSVGDFLKQRRRWFQGLVKVSLHAPVRRRFRAMLGFNTFAWAFAPLGLLYTVVHLFFGYRVNPAIRFGANLSFASFATLYLVGLRANLDEHGKRRRHRRLGWYVAQIVLLPVFSALESLGVAYAIARPHAGFHVVKK